MAEMILSKPLFPGKDHVHQFTLIAEILGKPSEEVMKKVFNETVWLRSVMGPYQGILTMFYRL